MNYGISINYLVEFFLVKITMIQLLPAMVLGTGPLWLPTELGVLFNSRVPLGWTTAHIIWTNLQ